MFDIFQLPKLLFGKLNRHMAQFFQANTVFSSDAAANGDTQCQNVSAEFFSLANLLRVARVKQNERV